MTLVLVAAIIAVVWFVIQVSRAKAQQEMDTELERWLRSLRKGEK